ncbi:Putative zinc-or iron-chelating domain-containing protein [Desulfocicer vacuolatum DSM 3385]|uniref:Putative zinc-or iron-chelating domain-containing protein n=1 Tax=Desulfocicer vacuolatum DSM 3385 TaxID=1121400 RepID=A0A1W2DTN2_9BACT|nr:YkgJ family cysteine cluster protein [Desulfocicer vacuolatum]SMD00811.1 Putative zinc-or iron-chelating domain-containing protein [Desulfocicer vacuolatum DSM 3385]
MDTEQTDAVNALEQLFLNTITSHLRPGITFDGFRSGLEKTAALAERIVTQVHQEQAGVSLACGAGCSYCCHAQVKVTPLEALVIFDWVGKNFSQIRRTLLKKRIDNNRKLTEGVNLEHRVMVKDQTPCIFLENGVCSIYPVRPLICRAWTSYSYDACEKAFLSENHTAEIESSAPSNFVYSLGRKIIEQVCKAYGLESRPLELPLAMAHCYGHIDLSREWIQGKIFFAKDLIPDFPVKTDDPSFMEIQVPAFLRRFSLSYIKDGTCLEYFLYSKEKKHEISTALIVSHDVCSHSINVSKFYPEIYKETTPKYMSAALFFLMMHHAAGIFDIHCDCKICLETKRMVFESFYGRLKDFDFFIHRHHVSNNCNVQGCYHDFPLETAMIREESPSDRMN